MNMKNSVKLIFASTLLTALCSCAGNLETTDGEGRPLGFDVAVGGGASGVSKAQDSTKAVLKDGFTDGDKFKVYAYDGATAVMSGVPVTKSNGNWTYSGTYLWIKDRTMNFYAFYPESMAGCFAGKISPTGVSAFTYSPFEDDGKEINGQTDLLLATYSGTGIGGKAPLNFNHPLASIQFKCGNLDPSFGEINSIEIKGFYDYGTCTPTCGETSVTYAWSDQNYSSSATLSQSGLGVTPASDVAIGTPFILIPGQNLSSNNLVVKVTGSTGRTAAGTLSQDTSLVAGMTSEFKINLTDSGKISFDPVTVTAWGFNTGGSVNANQVNPTSFDDVTLTGWGTVDSGNADVEEK